MRLRARGIVPVVQTPFTAEGAVDGEALARLAADAVAAGAGGLLAPAVASEVAFLDDAERIAVLRLVAAAGAPWIAGASDADPARCAVHVRAAADLGADAALVAVPARLYAAPDDVPAFFARAAAGADLPLVVQDFEPNGPGLSVATLARLRDAVPAVAGFKIETVPAGPKYTAVRAACGDDCWIAGGWAVPQMIEALDRGVDAMVPEASMVRVYGEVARRHAAGDRAGATALFRRLLPVLAFANQELWCSVAFFKRLLVAKEIFPRASLRAPAPPFDAASERVAAELVDLVLALEREIGAPVR